MRGMAIGAHGGYHQAALQEPLAMNTHGVIFYDILLIDFFSHTASDLAAGSMAFAAEIGNPGRKSW